MRILRKQDDGWNGFAAGFLAGYLSMFFLNTRKSFLATFLLSRGIECIYNYMTAHGYIKKKSIHWVLIYNLVMTFVFYACYCERHLLPAGAEKGFDFVATQSNNELIMLRLSLNVRLSFLNFPGLKNPNSTS